MKKPSPSMAEIALKAGVAKSTVSMALRNHPRIAQENRLRIQKIAQEMGYQTNALVAQLMAELRRNKKSNYVANLALINVSKFADLADRISVVAEWEEGTKQRALSLGYELDLFWLEQPGVSVNRLSKILHARGIQGAIFYGIRSNECLQRCEAIWSHLPTVTIGYRSESPALNFVTNDLYATALQACSQLREAGYKRIGIVLDKWLDTLLEHRYIAGYYASFPQVSDALPILYLEDPRESPRPQGKERFCDWVRRWRPDACVCINSFILDWVKELGIEMPSQMGVAFLDLSREFKGKVAGMYQSASWTGMKAVDLLVGHIHRRESGVPLFQNGLLIESQWSPGPTARKICLSEPIKASKKSALKVKKGQETKT
jgi:LacI family transcriptional regulator